LVPEICTITWTFSLLIFSVIFLNSLLAKVETQSIEISAPGKQQLTRCILTVLLLSYVFSDNGNIDLLGA
jgi:hypothetical protein